MTHEEKLELMRKEVRRLLAEYRDSEVCWQEMAGTVRLDHRLDLESQINVYAQVSKEIDGDNIYRYVNSGDAQYCQEVYGVSMRDDKSMPMTEEKMKRTLYGLYQLDWMISHGYSLDDLMRSMNNYEAIDHDPFILPNNNGDGMHANVEGIFSDWQDSTAFPDGSIWVCYEEFCDAELQDKEYIHELINRMESSIKGKILRQYNEYIGDKKSEVEAVCPKCLRSFALDKWNEVTEDSFGNDGVGITPLLEEDLTGELHNARNCLYKCPRCKKEVSGQDIIETTKNYDNKAK